MNKKIIALSLALASLAACNKKSESHEQFVSMCKDDPRAKSQGFDCSCQADIIEAVLKKEEMTQLIDFLNTEKADHNKALELSKDPKYTPIFMKISGIGLAIHDKCAPAGTPAAQPAAAPAADAKKEAAPAKAAKPAAEPAAEEPAPAANKE